MADITFQQLSNNELLPGFYLETAADNPSMPNQNTLIIGQTITAMAALPVFIGSVKAAIQRFGVRSQLASMVQSYLLSDVESPGVWVLPFADAGGSSAATGAISTTGTATAAGTLDVYVAGRHISVPVNVGDTGAAVAINLAAALQAYTDATDLRILVASQPPKGLSKAQLKKWKPKYRFYTGCQLPVTSMVDGVTATKVDITAANKGTAGNGIDIQVNYLGAAGLETIPAGLTVAVTAMSGGTGDPDISGIDNTLVNTTYDFVVSPWNTTTQLNSLQNFFATRWAPNRQIYGGAFCARRAAGSNGSEAITFMLTRNDPHTSVINFEPTVPNAEYDVAAAYAGAFAMSSRSDPAEPTQGLPLPGILGPHADQAFPQTTRETLVGSGAALMKYNPDHTCYILRAVSTYQLDSNGTPDMSWRDMETTFTIMAVNRRLKADYIAAFPRAKLADDGKLSGPGSQFSLGVPNQPVATPKSIKACLVASYSNMENNDEWVIDTATFTQGLIVQRRSTDPSRVDILYDAILIGGLRVTGVLNLFQLQARS